MLTLTRRAGQTIVIGSDIEITVVGVSGGRVRLGVRAPRSLAVHRGELVERVSKENRRALLNAVEESVAAGAQIRFPEGLFGLSEHTEFVLMDLEHDHIRCLMSCRDPDVQLLVIDAEVAWPNYPVARAREAAGASEESAVALILRIPEGDARPTANLVAPLVVELENRIGRQAVLEGPGLVIDAPLGQRARTQHGCSKEKSEAV